MKIQALSANDLPTRVDWMNDTRVNATLNIKTPVSLASTQEWFERIKDNPSRRDFAFTEDDKLVAMGGFTDIDDTVKKTELYIFVNPDMQGRGIGSRAVRLMCEYGFETLGFQKIFLHTNSDNLAARHLYERLGFTLEGFMPHEVINNGAIKDRCYYGLYPRDLTLSTTPPPARG